MKSPSVSLALKNLTFILDIHWCKYGRLLPFTRVTEQKLTFPLQFYLELAPFKKNVSVITFHVHVSHCRRFTSRMRTTMQLLLALFFVVNNAVAIVPEECDSLDNGVCEQTCTAAGCGLQCFNSEDYHSCKQYCTGEFPK